MSHATIKVLGHEATVSGRQWTCDSAAVTNVLNRFFDRAELQLTPKDGDATLRAAEYAIEQLNGELVEYVPPALTPGDVY